MEHQVAQAALAMVRPTTDPVTRRQASQFLEAWTQTPDAWDVYLIWIRSYRESIAAAAASAAVAQASTTNNDQQEQVALQLLCLTMLQSKIRREVLLRHQFNDTSNFNNITISWHHPQQLAAIRSELWQHLLQQPTQLNKALVGPLCLCNAALIVRCGELPQLISHIATTANNHNHNSTHNGIDNGSNQGGNTCGPEPSSASTLDRVTAFRLLACLPAELEACQGLTSPQVVGELTVHLEFVLGLIRQGLTTTTTPTPTGGNSNENNLLVVHSACQALKAWAETSHVSLSQLNTPTCGRPHAILPALIALLSTSQEGSTEDNSSGVGGIDERTLQIAAGALTDAILVVSDHCTPTREAAAAALWLAIPQQGFIVHPLQLATRNVWHDASHALATLLSTFVTEHVEDVVTQPAGVGLQVLLDLQRHPHTPVALIPLDCWLAIQDVDMSDRHEHWKRPLYRQLVSTLVTRMAYPPHFVSWEEELELDSSEFFEFRRLVTDVLATCYFLLRGEMIQMLTGQIRTATHWTASEAALYSLAQISKDVCVRCKSPASSSTMVGQDRQATRHELLELLNQLMTNVSVGGSNNFTTTSNGTPSQHPMLLAAVVNFCGAYSPAWNSMDCPPQAILQLLAYLQSAFSTIPLEAAKATRAIYVSCLAKNMPSLDDIQAVANGHEVTGNGGNGISQTLISASIVPMVLKSVRDSMEAVLSSSEEEAMTTVAEGATRLVTKLRDPTMARQALTADLIQPVLTLMNAALHALPGTSSVVNNDSWTTPQTQVAVEALMRYLSVLQIIFRFCDAPHIPDMGGWLLQLIGPCLEAVQQQTAATPVQSLLFPKWIRIHQQILRASLSQEETILAVFSSTIPFVVQVLEQTLDPATLKYISTAVENFGVKSTHMDRFFQELLSHVTTVVTRQNNLAGLTELLQAYFECLQRFTLYWPRALCYNPQFATIMTLSIESTATLKAKDSTRAALNFLSQLFGFHSLRLSPEASQVLQEAWNPILVDCLTTHGAQLTQSCVAGLAGGSQMLWPAYSDCLFAIVQAVVLNQAREEGKSATNPVASPASSSSSMLNGPLVQQWLSTSLKATFLDPNGGSNDGNGTALTAEACNQVITILLGLARLGPKSRPKAKLLLSDFAKIGKGEMSQDTLALYMLP